jgi:hypothetical protein
MTHFTTNAAALRRRQLCILEDDTGFLLNPTPDAAAVRSRQLAALQEHNEDEPPPNPTPNSASVRRRQLFLLNDDDDIGWAPGVTEPLPRNHPRPPTPPRINRNQEQEIQHRALQRLQSSIQAADDFLKSVSAPPPLVPPLPTLTRKTEYGTCYYIKPVIEIAIHTLILYHQDRKQCGGLRRKDRKAKLTPPQVAKRFRAIMTGLRLRINRRTRTAFKDGALLRLCDEILQSSTGHVSRQELTKANNVWRAVQTKQGSDTFTPDTKNWIRARNMFCKSTQALCYRSRVNEEHGYKCIIYR